MAETMKVLFIIVTAGFSDEIVELAQKCGSRGATIISARGTGQNFTKILGINYEPEREILLSVVSESVAHKISEEVKATHGKGTPSNALCFILPVEDCTLKSEE
ncbi:MAG TPA: P-II family nitrogen regulator [Bacilli bacterium]|nr:P-II family nitrogen regulator [Bacilli bacterium]HPS19111.1 P-II family nitrogen regulator [Bacilli bacterium]